MTKSRNSRENLIGCLRPHEGLGLLVVRRQVRLDGRLELAGAPMDAASELLGGQRRKPPFNQVQPRGTPAKIINQVNYDSGHLGAPFVSFLASTRRR